MITNDGMIDICSKFLLTTPIKKPNNANVKETKTNGFKNKENLENLIKNKSKIQSSTDEFV